MSSRKASEHRTEKPRPIVSSAHLASSRLGGLSEIEFAVTMVHNAYSRWMVRCMRASGADDFGPLDILVLHHVNHRERPKKLSDLCLVLNVEDTHVVNYALKKLKRAGLVAGEKNSKEILWSTTRRGRELCERYRATREQCLIEAMARVGEPHQAMSDVAALMRVLSGIYDQAARAAATL